MPVTAPERPRWTVWLIELGWDPARKGRIGAPEPEDHRADERREAEYELSVTHRDMM